MLEICTSFNSVHFSKAKLPILVTLSGIVMLVRPVQPLKAKLPILITLSGIVTFSNVLLQTTIVLVTVFEPSAIITSLILQPLKA